MSTLAALEVLTLEEAAEFLRIPPDSVLRLVRASELHGRQVDGNWRFLKDALRDWLRGPSPRESLLRTAGAWRDDPDLHELLEGVYRRAQAADDRERGMILLDTDILTLFFSGHEKVVKRARDEDEELAITVVTRYEILLGRFEFLLKASSEAQLLRAQEWLSRSEMDLASWKTLGVGPPAGDLFDQLRADKSIRKIGRADLLIACIALVHRARLVTRNTRHFLPISGLRVENWAD